MLLTFFFIMVLLLKIDVYLAFDYSFRYSNKNKCTRPCFLLTGEFHGGPLLVFTVKTGNIISIIYEFVSVL